MNKDQYVKYEFRVTAPAYMPLPEDKNSFHKVRDFFENIWLKLTFTGMIFKPDGLIKLRGINKKNVIYAKYDKEKNCYTFPAEYK